MGTGGLQKIASNKRNYFKLLKNTIGHIRTIRWLIQFNTSIVCIMRIVLKINQGVSKVLLSNPYCGSLYMYALNAIQK